MPWKTEIDRLVHHLVLDSGQSANEGEVRRAVRTVADLAQLAPGREANHFHVGALEELLAETPREGLEELLGELPAAEGDGAQRWRHLGRLDAAARIGGRDRVRALMDAPHFEACLAHPEGRVALRAVGRMLLRDGEGSRAFELYRLHLGHVPEEGSRRDAEFLLEESLRRVDRGDLPLEETLQRLETASAFAEECGLDARARSKVDRKAGRLHQLEGNWERATECYRRALDRLPTDDPYRSVLVGDLALATLGVRGTLDLVPVADREGRDAAREILESGQQGEGRSYNAIYTLGMLAYETGDWERAATYLREADELMRENRAKARIVHARSRFFLGHCMLQLGAEGEELEQAQRWVVRNAGAVSLDPEIKGVVFDALVERVPNVRIPGRPAARQAAGGGRAAGATQHLDQARQRLADGDPHGALAHVDKAFKSRPDFDTWFGAYRTRLEALLGLGEKDEAHRTYERFRAKLYQREATSHLEGFLRETEGPLAGLFGEEERDVELVDLYEASREHDDAFREAAKRLVERGLESGEAAPLRRAVSLLRELAARDETSFADGLEQAQASAQTAGALDEPVDGEETKSLLHEEEDPVRLLVVGGDVARPDLTERLEALAQEYGFQGQWIVLGARPPYKTLREIANQAQDADVVLLHHAVGPDMREEVRRLGEKYDVPVREAAWLSPANLEYEVLHTLKDAFVD